MKSEQHIGLDQAPVPLLGGDPLAASHPAPFVRLMPFRADQSAVIGINQSWEVRQEAGRSVGARVADEGLGGPLGSPVGGDGIVFHQDGSQGNRTRATIKALPSTPHHPRPYGVPNTISLG